MSPVRMEQLQRQPGGRLATDVVLDVSLEDLERDPLPDLQLDARELPHCLDSLGRKGFFEPAKDIFNQVYGDPNVINLNGPAHRDLRNAANPPFRPRAVNTYRDTGLRATAISHIDAIAPRGAAEVTGDVLEAISQRAAGDVLGFTDVDDETVSRWFHDYGAYLVDFGRSEQVAARGRSAKAEVIAYLEGRIPGLIENPDGSALSHMLHDGMPAGRTRSMEAMIGVLIVGRFQEPPHGIANSSLGLLGRSEQAERVAADLKAWSTKAIDEGMRWISPFGMTATVMLTDAVLHGLQFPAGTEVGLMIGSATRDPSRFPDPDVYDLDRPRQTHVAFGHGTHFCVGHSIARSLGQVVLEEMFSRLPGLRLDPDRAPVVHGWAVRGASSLPLMWDV